MINAKVTKNFDLKKIKLDLHRELNQGIDIIADDIEAGIDKGSQFGMVFAPNAESTVKKKGHGRPLIETGLMKTASKMQKTDATKSKQEATLTPNEKRIDVGFWNQEGTDNIPQRPHFAISIKAEKKVTDIVEKRIIKNIDRTRRARIA